ncbi:hypothetical protein [Sphingopyxis sp.]|jgi:hypothetical protein|uniref:hypothetical protein n=1 Tax=Sphingopyxis sp. TaxID=1908224 RepID=UPI003F72FFCD
MAKRDPLLGASGGSSPNQQPKSSFPLLVLGAIVLALGASTIWLLARDPQPEEAVIAQPPLPKDSGNSATPPVVEEKEILPPASIPQATDISMDRLTDADSNDLEMGCMGSFTNGKNDILYVSGGTLVFRPDGKRVLASVSDAEFQAFASDDATFNAEGYRIRLAPRGATEPGYDGHSVKAVLTVSKGTLATSFNGTWGFGC